MALDNHLHDEIHKHLDSRLFVKRKINQRGIVCFFIIIRLLRTFYCSYSWFPVPHWQVPKAHAQGPQ